MDHPYCLTHHHRHGIDVHFFYSKRDDLFTKVGAEKVSEILGLDYEPDKNEYLELSSAQVMDPETFDKKMTEYYEQTPDA